MKKIIYIIFIIIFIAFCIAPLAGFISGYENSNTEKRMQALLPSFINEKNINIEFTKEFDNYFTQNFAFRNDFISLYAPNKSSIYKEYMPNRYHVASNMKNTEKLYQLLDENEFSYINLHQALIASDTIVYHKLDTHWNNFGALFVYNEILNNIRKMNNDFDYNTHKELSPSIKNTWHGDLSDMLFPTSDILDEQYEYNIKKKYTAKRPIRSYEDMLIETTCEDGLLNLHMFRDSFANALIPMISNEFKNITYTRAVPYDYRNIEKTNILLLEIVERNLSNLILQAPLLSAPKTELNENIIEGKIDISIIIEDKNNYIKILGLAVADGYNKDENYDIYVRLQKDDVSHIYIPFPIHETGYFEDIQDKDNTAFSMLLDKSGLSKGEYQINIIIFYNEKYIYSNTADTIKIIK